MTAAAAPDPEPDPELELGLEPFRGWQGERAVAGYEAEAHRAARASGLPGSLDELVDPAGGVRADSRDLAASLDLLGADGLLARRERARRLVEDDGVTYGAVAYPAGREWDGDGDWDSRAPATPPGAGRWALDPLPLVLGAQEWAGLQASLSERAELLDAVVADLYGRRVLLHEGVLPPDVVLSHPEFIRPADQVRLPGSRRLFMSATDLGRSAGGGWVVLADRTQAPSGVGYAMANRRIVSRVLPALYRHSQLAQLRPFFDTLRAALQEVAPAAAEAPRVVLLSPGQASETAFDQAFLATILGYPLVEGGDLTVRDGRLWMRAVGRLEPVDVVLRRVDAWFCDPLDLRPDSRLGVPGLVEAARNGTVSVVNPLGAGILENPGLLPFLPAAGRLLLGAEPSLPSVATFWCGDPASRRHVLDRLPSLVVKPIGRGSGHRSAFGWELSTLALEDLRRRIEAAPGQWCGQEPLEMSTAPVVTDTGLAARHLVLRAFAVVHAGAYRLMTGGLARVSGQQDSRFVASSNGALAKDVWVRSDAAVERAPALRTRPDVVELLPAQAVTPALAPRVAEDLFWLGRYAERAEDTARLLRVVDELAADYGHRPDGPGAAALAVMLASTTHVTATYPGFIGIPGGRSAQAELLHLVVDTSRPGTVGFAVRRTVEAAQAVREQLSRDTWVVLGAIERAVADLGERATLAAPGDEPPVQPVLARVLEGLLAIAGLGAESMVRDTGWYFMDLGRRLERALQVLALVRHVLAHEHAPVVEALLLESVLQAGESVITFGRRHPAGWAPLTGNGPAPGAPGRVQGVLDLLLSDKANPRAVAHQLDRIAIDLWQLRTSAGQDGLDRSLRTIQARVREIDPGALALGSAGGDRGELVAVLDTLSRELSQLAQDVDATYFVHAAPLRQLPVATPGWQ